MRCRSCKLNIEETLDELDGVIVSDVDVAAKVLTVTYDPELVTPAAIAAAVTEAGYPATVR